MSTNELTKRVEKLKELKKLIEQFEGEVKTLENEIKAEMTSREVDELNIGTSKIHYKTVISNRFDTTSFKKSHKTLYAKFSKPSESKRFILA